MEFLDGKFEVSVSRDVVKDKDSDIWKRLKYEKKTVDLTEFVELIKEQYAFCGIFNKDVFGQSDKLKSNWLSTNIISIDLDKRQIPYKAFMEIITNSDIVPNIAYRTQNDGKKGKGYRYRLLYIVSDKIINERLYKEIYNGISDRIKELTGEDMEDNCGGVISQSFAGTPHTDDIFTDEIYYNTKTLKKMFGIHTLNITEHKAEKSIILTHKREEKNIICYNDTFSVDSQQFITDYQNLPILELIDKYSNTYANIESTPLEIPSDDIAYIIIPKDYIEIKRYWFQEIDEDERKSSRIRKIKDGMGRRKKLFLNGIIRRLINPSISFDNLLYNLICEFSWYMLNDGNKIYKKDIYEIASRVYTSDLSRYQNLKGIDKDFIVNPNYCKKYNVSKRTARNIARKQRTNQLIGEIYDFSLKIKDNLEILKSYGVEVSEITLKRWKKENGLTKKYKVNN